MISIKIVDETSPLEAVVLGIAEGFGGAPGLEEAYDPKSRQHIINGTFPIEKELVEEIEGVAATLEKYGVKVYRPRNISNCNQVFSRDISIGVDDRLVMPSILENRRMEAEGIRHITDQVTHTLKPAEAETMEGGDVMPWKGKLFVGYSRKEEFEKYQVARTNEAGVEFLINHFKDWDVKAFELKKSDNDPEENALHLDCCFQPVGKDRAVICREGFRHEEHVTYLIDFFGKEHVFEITKKEMYDMNGNFFSISPDVVISDSGFVRLNAQFRAWGLTVEEVNYREVAKMGGLLRCSTLPIRRND